MSGTTDNRGDVMKQPFKTNYFGRFLRTKKFYLPLCLAVAAFLVWLGIDLWRRWTIAALVIGILVEVLGGCRGVRLFKAS
jgi:hypothetical protein